MYWKKLQCLIICVYVVKKKKKKAKEQNELSNNKIFSKMIKNVATTLVLLSFVQFCVSVDSTKDFVKTVHVIFSNHLGKNEI